MDDIKKVSGLCNSIVSSLGSDVVWDMYKSIKTGKMLRSKLILSICDSEEAYLLCAIVELIQSASLLHDDVIDNSSFRRSSASVNSVFGNKSAIMLGDILYSSAFCELGKFSKEIIGCIAGGVVQLSIGELLDVSLSSGFNSSRDLYIDMIKAKSASLIAASARCAAIISGRSDHEVFYSYGLNLGLAFQIVDDIIDITQDDETLGKPGMSDYSEGKTTLPYICLYEILDESGRSELVGKFKKSLSCAQKEDIRRTMFSSGAIDMAIQVARHYGREALAVATRLNNADLENMVGLVIDRVS